MAQAVALQTSKREQTGKSVKGLRENGQVPGVIYGQGKEAVSLQADAKILHKVYNEAGTSKLVDTKIGEDEPISALFYDVQMDPLTDKILHFDLYMVKMDEEIHTEVPLHFTGDSEAVIVHQAELMTNLESVEVSALPRNLPENIEVDISVLKSVGDHINVADLKLPEGVEVLVEPETLVVRAEEARVTDETDFEEVEEVSAEDVDSEHGGADEDADGAGGDDGDDKKDDKKEPAADAKPTNPPAGKDEADKKDK